MSGRVGRVAAPRRNGAHREADAEARDHRRRANGPLVRERTVAKNWRHRPALTWSLQPRVRPAAGTPGCARPLGNEGGPADGKDDRSPEDVPGPVCCYFFFLVAFFFVPFFLVAFFFAMV